MADEHGNAHARRGELDLGIENLLGLDHHLPLFLGIARIHEHIDMRNDVEGDLLGELLWRWLVGDENALGLRPQFVEAFLARPRHRLIGRHNDALDLGHVVERLQGHDELRRRAIRVGDDIAAVGPRHIVRQHMGVHFRNHQRHILLVAKARGIIDDDAAHGANFWRPFLGDGRARRHQAEIHPREIELLQILALQHAVAEGDFHTHRLSRGDGVNLIHRKQPFLEDREHFAAHIAGGTDDRNLVTHVNSPKLPSNPTPWNHFGSAPGHSPVQPSTPAGDEAGGEGFTVFWWFSRVSRA